MSERERVGKAKSQVATPTLTTRTTTARRWKPGSITYLPASRARQSTSPGERLLNLGRTRGNAAVGHLLQRERSGSRSAPAEGRGHSALTDRQGNHYTFEFRIAAGLPAALARVAKEAARDGPITRAQLRRLQRAVRDSGSTDHVQQMFLAGLLDPDNVRTLMSTPIEAGASLDFSLESIRAGMPRIRTRKRRGTAPAVLLGLPHASPPGRRLLQPKATESEPFTGFAGADPRPSNVQRARALQRTPKEANLASEPLLDYDSLCDASGHMATNEQALRVFELIRDADQLDRLYADAKGGQPRAATLIADIEQEFAKVGREVATQNSRLVCKLPVVHEVLEGCIPNWSAHSYLKSERVGGLRLREVIGEAYATEATQLGLRNALILNALNALGALGMAAKMARGGAKATPPTIPEGTKATPEGTKATPPTTPEGTKATPPTTPEGTKATPSTVAAGEVPTPRGEISRLRASFSDQLSANARLAKRLAEIERAAANPARDGKTLKQLQALERDLVAEGVIRGGQLYYPERGLMEGGKHGIEWTEGRARALKEAKAQGQFGSADDVNFAVDQASQLGPGKSGTFPLPAGNRSVVHMPDGRTVPARSVFVKVYPDGKVHAYPLP